MDNSHADVVKMQYDQSTLCSLITANNLLYQKDLLNTIAKPQPQMDPSFFTKAAEFGRLAEEALNDVEGILEEEFDAETD